MTPTDTKKNKRPLNLLPVIVGGDIGVYGIGRAFYEAFRARSICVASAPADMIARSKLFEVVHVPPRAGDDVLLETLISIAKENSDADRVLMANTDKHVSFVAKNREVLSKYYALPFPTMEVINELAQKDSFAKHAAELGILTPPTQVVDFADKPGEQWAPPALEFDFPVVAKPVSGDEYEKFNFPGKKKIWFIENQAELDEMWSALHGANYPYRFLIQAIIPGDNTALRSVSCYVDSSGRVTAIGSAIILLEDRTPTLVGNPVAMLTQNFPELRRDATRILEKANYRGFANFDVKIDSETGEAYFFEVNPRIGRSSYYLTAGGLNPIIPMVRDLVLGEKCEPKELSEEVVYSLVPNRLLLRYIPNEKLRDRVRDLMRQKKVHDPLLTPHDVSVRRSVIVRLQKLNQYRKFGRYYPKPTESGF